VEEKHGSVTIDKAPASGPEPPHNPWSGVRFAPREVGVMPEKTIKMKALKPHMGPGGGVLAVDSEYELTSEHEALDHVAKGIGERLSPPPPPEGEEPADDGKAPADGPWLLNMEPDAYLKKHGEDKKYSAAAHAELARREAAGKVEKK